MSSKKLTIEEIQQKWFMDTSKIQDEETRKNVENIKDVLNGALKELSGIYIPILTIRKHLSRRRSLSIRNLAKL
jgi:hypothetical protein